MRLFKRRAFNFKKFSFPVQPTGKPAQPATTGEDAMAWNNDWNGIGAASLADGAGSLRTPQGMSKFAVGTCPTARDAQQREPKLLLKFCAHGQIQGRQHLGGFAV